MRRLSDPDARSDLTEPDGEIQGDNRADQSVFESVGFRFFVGPCAKGIQNPTATGDAFTIFPMGPDYPGVLMRRGTFTGSAVEPDGEPLVGAEVTATVTGPEGTAATATATVDADGNFMLTSTSNRGSTFEITIDSIACPGEEAVESGETAFVALG
jgi:hypothetical protein